MMGILTFLNNKLNISTLFMLSRIIYVCVFIYITYQYRHTFIFSFCIAYRSTSILLSSYKTLSAYLTLCPSLSFLMSFFPSSPSHCSFFFPLFCLFLNLAWSQTDHISRRSLPLMSRRLRLQYVVFSSTATYCVVRTHSIYNIYTI